MRRSVGWAILLALTMWLLASCAEGSEEASQEQPTATPIPTAPAVARPTYVVQRGDVQETLVFTGRWLPRDQMALGFETAGTVRRVEVRRDTSVTAGQLLADLQIDDLEQQLASAELELESAQAGLESGESGAVESVADAEIAVANARLQLQNQRASSPWTQVESARISLDDAQRNLENAERDYREALSHPEQPANNVDSARRALEDARSRLRSAEVSYYSAAQSFNNHQFSIQQSENALLQAQLNLERIRSGAGDPQGQQAVRSAQLRIDQIREDIRQSSLYAPIDGVVLEITIQPGDQVQAFAPVITIGLPEPREVIASLPVQQAQQLSVGLVGVCNILNHPETAVQCAVRQIPASARDADQTTRVSASLEDVADGPVVVEVQMPLQVREDVLWLPPAAIRTFQNRTFVVLETADGPRSVDVQIGLQTDERVEIISGVQEGDVVMGQ